MCLYSGTLLFCLPCYQTTSSWMLGTNSLWASKWTSFCLTFLLSAIESSQSWFGTGAACNAHSKMTLCYWATPCPMHTNGVDPEIHRLDPACRPYIWTLAFPGLQYCLPSYQKSPMYNDYSPLPLSQDGPSQNEEKVAPGGKDHLGESQWAKNLQVFFKAFYMLHCLYTWICM